MKYISLDTETHDPFLNDRGPSWVYGEGKVLVTGLYDVAKQKKGYIDGAGGKAVRDFLLSASTTLIGAKIDYDLGWLCYEHKLQVKDTKCQLIDVQVAESFIDEYQPFDLDSLAQKYLGETKQIHELAGLCARLGYRGDPRKHLLKIWDSGEEGKQMIRKYVIADADQPARIWEKQKEILEREGAMPAFLMNMKMLKVTVKMKQRGVRVDYKKWEQHCQTVEPIRKKLYDNFTAKWGKCNVNSVKQLGALLDSHNVPFKYRITIRGWEQDQRKFNCKTDRFKGHQIPDQKRRLKDDFPNIRIEKDRLRLYVDKVYRERTVRQLETMGYNVIAGPNVDKYFIADYKTSYPVVADLAELKIVGSIISKFLGPKFGRFLVYHPESKAWRLHGNFNVVGARQTGRLSASMPNLQNIPSKTVLFAGTDYEVDLSVMCREIFVPEPGEVWVKLDFSGQENRLQAHFASAPHGKRIREMYNENPRLDEHQFVATASGLEEEYGKKNGRKYAKNVRFGLSYGVQVARVCTQFGWTREFAEELKERVCDASPWFIDTLEAVVNRVLQVGFIRLLSGRRVHYRDWTPKLDPRYAKVYPFYNYLIQGSAADQTKKAQTDADDTETLERLLLSVHDEGGYSLPMTDEGLKRLKELQRYYVEAYELDVPVICDPAIGSDWAHCEDLALWTEDDFKAGKCKKEQIDYPKETIDTFWKRMIKQIKAQKPVKARVFDLAILDETEDADEEDGENDDD